MDKKVTYDKIAKAIHEKDPHADAYLFGSRARGDNKDSSDWDILILVNIDESSLKR